MPLKYVILKKTGFLVPLVFDGEILSHAEASPPGFEVLSAGFCDLSSGPARVWGRSESLGVESRPGDQEVIRRTIAQERPLTMQEAGYHP